MTKDQILKALDLYESKFPEGFPEGGGLRWFKPKRYEEHYRNTTPIDRYNHAWWMILEIRKMLAQPEPNMEKVFRWMGFLQGILWCQNEFSIEEMKDHNR